MSTIIQDILSVASFNESIKNFQFYRGSNKKPFYLNPKYHQQIKQIIAEHVLYDIENGERDEDEFCLKRTFNEPHKMMIDIDCSHTEKVKNPIGNFINLTIVIGKLANSKDYKLFTREPYFDEQHQTWKYGAHICYYDTVIAPNQGHYDIIINDSRIIEIIEDLKNEGFNPDIDKCSYNNSGVGLIGSRKAGSHQYFEVAVCLEDNTFTSLSNTNETSFKTRIIRKPNLELLLSQIDLLFPDDACHEWIVPFQEKVNNVNNVINSVSNLEIVERYVNLIDPKYFEIYDDWIKLGAAIKNARGTVDMFDSMSKRGKGYRDFDDCKTKWDSIGNEHTKPATLGTIRYYAKLSNPIEYNALNQDVACNEDIDWIVYHQEDRNVAEWILNQKNGKIFNIINTVFTLCDKENNKTSRGARWFRFNDVYYKPIDETKLSKEIFDAITRLLIDDIFENKKVLEEAKKEKINYAEGQLVIEPTDKIIEIENHIKLAKKLKSTINTCKFVNTVMAYLQNILMKPMTDFVKEFNDDKGHVVFDNCIYDAVNKKIIEKSPKIKNTLSCKLDYNPMPNEDNIKIFKEKIMTPIFVDIRVRDFMYKILAKLLTSDRIQYFFLFNGKGSNGKSLLIRLLTNLTGDYMHNVQQTFLTRAANKGAADSDLADAVHKRIITVNEPDYKSQLSADIIKTISGNDMVTARGLFKDPIRYEPFAKLIITCNTIPQFSELSSALERRLVNIRFESRFLNEEKYNELNELNEDNIYLIDESLEQKIKDKTFLSDIASWLLQEHYQESDILNLPDPCKIARKEVLDEQDIYKDFIERTIEKVDDDENVYITLDSLYTSYKNFIEEFCPGEKPDSFRRGFLPGLRRNGLKMRNDKNACIRGYKFISELDCL